MLICRDKNVWGNSPRDRWDHDGFEELMKIEDEERRRKEFQHRIQHRREFVPPVFDKYLILTDYIVFFPSQ